MKTKENVTYEEEPIAEGALTELYSLLEALESLSAEVKAASKVLSDLEHSARILSEETIPAHMEELGLAEFHTLSGRKVKIRKKVFASTAQKKDPQRHLEAMQWLVDNGHSGLITCNIGAKFSKGQVQDALKLQDRLKKEGYGVAIEEGVHHSTLGSWVRGMLEDGEDFPQDLFGVATKQLTEIK